MLAPPRLAGSDALARARLLALALPLLLLGGALTAQYAGGLAPCEMCWWQRYPHAAAIVFALAANALPLPPARIRLLTALAALAIAVSGAIGLFHAGVEYKWWEGVTTCTAGGATSLQDIMAAPLVRCDQAQWALFGVSLAGFNALFSLGGAALIGVWLARAREAA